MGAKKKKRFIKAEATAEWLETQKIDNEEEARAVIAEHAYHALELARVTGNKLDAASLHFNTKGIPGAGSLVPGMEVLAATSNFCCICNDANPPQCACVPC